MAIVIFGLMQMSNADYSIPPTEIHAVSSWIALMLVLLALTLPFLVYKLLTKDRSQLYDSEFRQKFGGLY